MRYTTIRNENQWEEIIEYILIEGKHIHKLYSVSGGICYLTEHNGARHKITDQDSLGKVKALVNRINETDRPQTIEHGHRLVLVR